MPYHVKEIYYTLQGEGLRAGRPAVFCRFTGCNLWSGRASDRAGVICSFCDTDFVGTDGPGGGVFQNAEDLAAAVARTWPVRGEDPGESDGSKRIAAHSAVPRYVVFTGGEPLLQLDAELVAAVRCQGFESAVETNGTVEAPPGLDWITVSPKSLERLVQRTGSELKLLYPFVIPPEAVNELEFDAFLLSPIITSDAGESARNTRAALEFCLANPQWRLSAQLHKIWNIP